MRVLKFPIVAALILGLLLAVLLPGCGGEEKPVTEKELVEQLETMEANKAKKANETAEERAKRHEAVREKMRKDHEEYLKRVEEGKKQEAAAREAQNAANGK